MTQLPARQWDAAAGRSFSAQSFVSAAAARAASGNERVAPWFDIDAGLVTAALVTVAVVEAALVNTA